jgi:hypothetical protein
MSSQYIPGSAVPGAVAVPEKHESAVEDVSSSPPVLMIAAPSPATPRFGTLFWLSHRMGLDIYGSATLSYAARVDMNAAALVLAAIFLFDTAAWCLLFYFIVNSGAMNFSPGGLVLASGGLLPAVALFLYERSFMTADTKSRGWKRLLLPTAIRLLVIVSAAWITAQPVELLTFGQRIKSRVQQELVRKNIVGYYQELKEAQAKQGNAAGAGKEMQDFYMKKLEKATTLQEQLSKKAHDISIRLDAARRDESAKRSVLNNAVKAARERIRQRNSREDPLLDPDVQHAQSAYGTVKADVFRLSGELAETKLDQEDAQNNVENIEKQKLPPVIARKNADVTTEGLKKWVQRLKKVPPGSGDWLEEDGKKYELAFVDYDFLEKFRIIDDVLSGRPPRWPGADADMIAYLKQQYGMYDITDTGIATKRPATNLGEHGAEDAKETQPKADPAGAASHGIQQVEVDPLAQERNLAEIRSAKRMYWAIFAVAVIIPLLSLLFKLVMPPHLAYYYSSRWQAQQGNPWALAMEGAIESMEGQRSKRSAVRFSGRVGSAKRNASLPTEWLPGN